MGRPSSDAGMGCTRTIKTACSSGYRSIEDHLCFKPRRPRYFQPPPYVTMSANTLYPITVAADGPQSRTIPVQRVIRDERLGLSLINARIAEASGGDVIRLSAPETCQDSRGQEHHCTTYVELRWRQWGTARSWSEKFYIINDCGDQLEAILRSNISLATSPSPESLPLEHRTLTEGRNPATRMR